MSSKSKRVQVPETVARRGGQAQDARGRQGDLSGQGVRPDMSAAYGGRRGEGESNAPCPGPADPPGTNRSTSATIQPNILRCLAVVADEHGIDLRPVLKQVGLDETVMRSAALRVSYRQGSTVIRRAVELTGDERLGLKVGAAQHLTAWGLLGFALMADDTLRHAIGTGVKYQNLSGAMVVWSAGAGEVDDAFVLRADLPDPAMDPVVATFLLEEAFASVVTLSRLAVSADFAPRVVEFSFPPPRQDDLFAALFGCPVRFGAPANRLVIDAAWARTRMPGRDPVSHASTLEMLDAQLASRRDQQDLLEVLEISVAQSLPWRLRSVSRRGGTRRASGRCAVGWPSAARRTRHSSRECAGNASNSCCCARN